MVLEELLRFATAGRNAAPGLPRGLSAWAGWGGGGWMVGVFGVGGGVEKCEERILVAARRGWVW